LDGIVKILYYSNMIIYFIEISNNLAFSQFAKKKLNKNALFGHHRNRRQMLDIADVWLQ
jgi:hypothetical protein